MSKSKLKCILLVDDDEATNYLHKMIIEEAGCAENCLVVENGQEALDLLTSKHDGEFLQPDLILLDINMPRMNGWEFLVEYGNLNPDMRGMIVLIMLTTSMNPDDQKKAEVSEHVNGFISKPLTVDAMDGVIEKHFDEAS